MRPETRRKILVITVAAAVIAALSYGFMPKPVQVDIAVAVKGQMKVTVDEEGKVRVKERFVVSAPVAGFLRRVGLKAGDAINKGQVIAELEPLRSAMLDPRSRAEALATVSAAQAALNAAREDARSAEAAYEYARSSSERLRKLFNSGYIAKDALEQSEAEAKRTEAGRLSAAANVRMAEAGLERARGLLGHSAAEAAPDREKVVLVRAPVSGRVLKLHHESEGVVPAGEPLVDLGDPAGIEVKSEVLSSEAVKIRPGMSVHYERWGGSDPLSGVVKTVEPSAFTKISSLGVEEQRVIVTSDISSSAESLQKLGDGYRVETSFVIWEGRDVLQVPSSALFRRGDSWAVFVAENGRATLRDVTVGQRNGLSAEIVKGLAENEKVISHPDDTVKEGIRVKQRNNR